MVGWLVKTLMRAIAYAILGLIALLIFLWLCVE